MKKMWTIIVLAMAIGTGVGFAATVSELGVFPDNPKLADTGREVPPPTPSVFAPSKPNGAKSAAAQNKTATKKKKPPRKLMPPPATEPQPVARVDSISHNFGAAEASTKGSHNFIIRNAGEGVLQLQKGKAPCSCTLGKLSKKTLQPGETAEVKVTWTLKSRRQKFEKRFPIHTNDPRIATLYLRIKGESVPEFQADPSTVSLFRQSAGKAFQKDVNMMFFTKEDVKITGHQWGSEKNSEHFTFSYTPIPAEELAELDKMAKVGYKLHVGVGAEHPVGSLRQELIVETEPKMKRPVSVQIMGSVVGEITIVGKYWDQHNSTLRMGRKKMGEGEQWQLLLIANADKWKDVDFSVANIRPDFLTVELKERQVRGKGENAIVQIPLVITLPPESPIGSYLGNTPQDSGRIVIETGDSEYPELLLNLQFEVVK